MSLFEHAASFLEAEGWQVDRLAKGPASVVGRQERFGSTEFVTVWCPGPDDLSRLRSWVPGSLKRFEEDRNQPGHKVLLLDSRAGLDAAYFAKVKEFGVTTQAPIEFFDAQFCWDETAPKARRAASAGNRINDAGLDIAKKRTPQPYRAPGGDTGDDLLSELTRKFESSAEWEKPIVLVTAPAGFGKTWLFQSLFAKTHEHFKDSKGRRDRARRPLPLLPDHVTRSSGGITSLVEQFLLADVAGAMQRPRFEWMLNHGYACWMLDGLDEVIASDPHFFEYIETILIGADKIVTPRILICARDSLLSTSDGLRNLVGDVDSPIAHYQLARWQQKSIETFAKMRLSTSDWKMTSLLKQPQILELCGTPHYCDLIATRIETNTIALGVQEIQETELVDDAIRSIIVREYDKGVDAAQLPYADIRSLIREAAVWQLRDTPRGISTAELSEHVDILLMDLEKAERKKVLGQVLKLSVFGSDRERDHVRFAQDVIFEHLIGEEAITLFSTQADRLVTLLNYQGFGQESITLRLLARRINQLNAVDTLRDLLDLAAEREAATALRNLLCVAMQTRDPASLLQECSLERADLSKLAFTGLVLNGVSMRGANLEAATFDRCDLTGLDLSEALLLNTGFNHCRATIFSAEYGKLTGFDSVVIDGRQTLDTHESFVRYLQQSAKKHGVDLGPCTTAEQTRKVFLRFLYPNGKVRRVSLERGMLLRGMKATSSTALLDTALKAGFLQKTAGREQIKSTTGPLLHGMTEFVRNFGLSDEISNMLDTLCPTQGCSHVGRV